MLLRSVKKDKESDEQKMENNQFWIMILVVGGLLILANAILCFIAGGIVSNHSLSARFNLGGICLFVVLILFIGTTVIKIVQVRKKI